MHIMFGSDTTASIPGVGFYQTIRYIAQMPVASFKKFTEAETIGEAIEAFIDAHGASLGAQLLKTASGQSAVAKRARALVDRHQAQEDDAERARASIEPIFSNWRLVAKRGIGEPGTTSQPRANEPPPKCIALVEFADIPGKPDRHRLLERIKAYQERKPYKTTVTPKMQSRERTSSIISYDLVGKRK